MTSSSIFTDDAWQKPVQGCFRQIYWLSKWNGNPGARWYPRLTMEGLPRIASLTAKLYHVLWYYERMGDKCVWFDRFSVSPTLNALGFPHRTCYFDPCPCPSHPPHGGRTRKTKPTRDDSVVTQSSIQKHLAHNIESNLFERGCRTDKNALRIASMGTF